jgi:Acyl-protein synthetase, LuxE
VGSIEQSEALHSRVRAFISGARLPLLTEGARGATERAEGAPSAPDPFDALAIAVARYQAAACAPVARLFGARGVRAGELQRADQIPAVPCDVFRFARVATHPPDADAVVFRTSGTTLGAGSRGEHALRTTATYELAALSWGARMLWPDRDTMRVLVLSPPLSEAPDSSLGFMLDRFAARLGGPASWHVRGGALDVVGFARACGEARDAGEPAIVLGTSFAFVHLLEAQGTSDLTLPAGSRAMQTGGFKGRSREVPAEELRRSIARSLGVPLPCVVSEYGMTELSSQLYEDTLARALAGAPEAELAGTRRYVAPPWVRVTAVDQETLSPLPDGEIGLARIVDLANVDSAVAIQTADRVRVTDGCVELLSRVAGAPPRGCSIAIDQMLGGAR